MKTDTTNTTASTTADTSPEPVAIHERAMLVALRISTWTARKFDRRLSEQFNAEHGATSDAGRYNKLLLPGDATAYRTLVKTANAARSDHYANTLPWTDEGWRVLPTANYMTYAATMRKHGAAFGDALDEFVAAFPAMRELARERLNGLYRESDYPSPVELRQRFRYGVDYAPLPARGDFRLDLPAAELDRMERAVSDRVQAATVAAVRDAWSRLEDAVGKFHERLAEPDAIFRNSLVGNLRDLVDVLARLNLTGDPELERFRVRVAGELTIHEPETYRDDPATREDAAKRADRILADMRAVYGGQGATS